jgi:hypothetical protein
MARPGTKGGVVVALLQPHSSQDNSDGFLAGKRNCSTVNAVSELITVASNAIDALTRKSVGLLSSPLNCGSGLRQWSLVGSMPLIHLR